PETGHLGSLALAERIRCDIEELAIPHRGSPSGCMTVSLGVYTVHCDGTVTPQALIERADRQLYRAKSAGRNQVSAGQSES
ncbi:MAG: diguanylate cyclase, partial [Azonexus sp.]|nr:diguanylate cyclase [Azonexus sp.]